MDPRRTSWSFLSPPINSLRILRICRKIMFQLNIWNSHLTHSAIYNNFSALGKRPSVNKRLAKLKCGLVNARSAVNNAAFLNDVICKEKIDIHVVTETWIPSDAPRVLQSLSLLGYSVCHSHHGTSSNKREGGLAVVYNNLLRAAPINNKHNIVCFNSTLFRPPSTIIHSCRRSFRRLNYRSFENDLNRAFDYLFSQYLEVDEFASTLNTTLNDIAQLSIARFVRVSTLAVLYPKKQ
ncbi:hypothetical protein HELRODRAFT_171460 [Helobdella robusta]|uniref:Endonuclease/exonuclease/phosphatase domain-containing protein n=1 Tax=Helobdella robusta TaxID=6412 RepID=T1F4B2_HELRO|nr:hypothetical protein HELRODRAFT_171460 [Helobdella robusta]ESO05788.1 hypothetical protein HELRODRAFT_171460 [Helobdella robusta]